jgi:hypothetical protein
MKPLTDRLKEPRYRYFLQNPHLRYTGLEVKETYEDIDRWLLQLAVYDTWLDADTAWDELVLPENKIHFDKIKDIVNKMEYTPDQIGFYHKRFYQGVIEILDNRCH